MFFTQDRPTLYHTGSDRIRSILDACPTLSAPYTVPLGCTNPHLHIAALLVFEAYAPQATPTHTDILTAPDGGTLSTVWFCGPNHADASTPILLINPTICGDHNSLSWMVRDLQELLGWDIVVCNRRGHSDLPLTAPRVNTMGNTEDLRQQIAHVRAKRPDASLHALGISAGSGLLTRYLGEEGASCPLTSAILHSPAYDIATAFDFTHPRYDRYMTQKLIRYFLEPNEGLLGEQPGYAECMQTTTLSAYHRAQYGVSGYASAKEYDRACNPIHYAPEICVPTLVLNPEDDPVCAYPNVEAHGIPLAKERSNMLLVTTRYGSHCGMFEHVSGTWWPRSWGNRVIAEFLRATEDRI